MYSPFLLHHFQLTCTGLETQKQTAAQRCRLGPWMPVFPPARATFSKGSPLWISFAHIVSLPFILILQTWNILQRKHPAPQPTQLCLCWRHFTNPAVPYERWLWSQGVQYWCYCSHRNHCLLKWIKLFWELLQWVGATSNTSWATFLFFERGNSIQILQIFSSVSKLWVLQNQS